MADLFLSYSRSDRARVVELADVLGDAGRSLWWDTRLAAGQDYSQVIEREIDAARCVLVSWSGTARDSLWVRAEANAALDQGKLVQVNLDGSKLPLPFTMLHCVDLKGWKGERAAAPWPEVERHIGAQIGDAVAADDARRPDPGGVPVVPAPEKALQGLGGAAFIGWTASAVVLVIALIIVAASRGSVDSQAFTILSFAALAVAVLLCATAIWLLIRVERASRR